MDNNMRSAVGFAEPVHYRVHDARLRLAVTGSAAHETSARLLQQLGDPAAAERPMHKHVRGRAGSSASLVATPPSAAPQHPRPHEGRSVIKSILVLKAGSQEHDH